MEVADEVNRASAGTITTAIIAAVVAANSTDGGQSGVVDLQAAIDGICGALGILAQQSDNFPTPRSRRQFADACGRQILGVMNELTKRETTADPFPWKMQPIES